MAGWFVQLGWLKNQLHLLMPRCRRGAAAARQPSRRGAARAGGKARVDRAFFFWYIKHRARDGSKTSAQSEKRKEKDRLGEAKKGNGESFWLKLKSATPWRCSRFDGVRRCFGGSWSWPYLVTAVSRLLTPLARRCSLPPGGQALLTSRLSRRVSGHFAFATRGILTSFPNFLKNQG